MGMMNKLKEAQKKVEETKERLHSVLLDEASSDGKLKVTITANRTIKSLEIEEELLTTPWNLSQSYLFSKQNKGMMVLNGIGDPSNGHGGFSFLKLPMKSPGDRFFKDNKSAISINWKGGENKHKIVTGIINKYFNKIFS